MIVQELPSPHLAMPLQGPGLPSSRAACRASHLAMLLQDQGESAEEEPLLLEARHVRRITLDGEHPDSLSSVYYLATLLQGPGNQAATTTTTTTTAGVRERSPPRYEESLGIPPGPQEHLYQS